MKKFRSRLTKRDGTVTEEHIQTINQMVEGYRRLLERDDADQFYLFRRYPLCADNETLEVHIHSSLVKDDD